jgi:hypothetical protein
MMRDVIWYQLRESRARPPGLAGEVAERRQVYTAALDQFEELIEAAAGVSPRSRPLPLYYAVSQAGLAISAAYAEDYGNRGHGLTVPRIEEDILETMIVPKRRPEEFQSVCTLVGSRHLSAPAQLGALWRSLPELWDTLLDDRWSSAVRLWPNILSRNGRLRTWDSNLGKAFMQFLSSSRAQIFPGQLSILRNSLRSAWRLTRQ